MNGRQEMPAQNMESLFSRWRVLGAGCLIVAAGLLAYHNSFDGPFIYDDTESIVENAGIRQLWPIWSAPGESAKPSTTAAGRPVLNLSLALNYQISSLEVWSYHAVNLAIHILAGLTLFGIVRRTLMSEGLRERFGQVSLLLALISTLIWVVHPLQTGSVTYIVQRAESLMGMFYLVSLYCVIRGFSSSRNRWWYAGAIGSCALGVGTKEVAATAPILILLYDRIYLSQSFKAIFAKRFGLYAGLAGTWVLFGVLAWTAPRGESVGFGHEGLTAWVYGLTQCKVIVLYYLKLAFWPRGLVLDYGWPICTSIGEVWLYAMVLLGLLAGTFAAIAGRRLLGFTGIWFFVILGPSSSFIPIVTEVAAEHRMYLPLAAVIVAVVACGYTLGVGILNRLAVSDGARGVLGRVSGFGLAGTIIVVLCLLTVQRNYDYKDEISIWDDTIRKQGHNWRALINRGRAYSRMGQYDKAIGDFNQVIVLHETYASAYYNRGNAYCNKGDLMTAIRDYDKAIELNPGFTEAYSNRGSTYGMQGRYDLAIDDINEAIKLNPEFARSYYNRGAAFMNKGEYERAIMDFNRAIELNPDYAEAHSNREVASDLLANDEER